MLTKDQLLERDGKYYAFLMDGEDAKTFCTVPPAEAPMSRTPSSKTFSMTVVGIKEDDFNKYELVRGGGTHDNTKQLSIVKLVTSDE